MRSMRNVFLAMLVCLGGYSAVALEEITGAFGFQFGEILDESYVISTKTDEDGTYYMVKAKKPDPQFKEYRMSVTEKSKKIYEIVGTAEFPGKKEAKAQLKAILKALEAKYGPSEIDPDTKAPQITTKDGYVFLDTNDGAKSSFVNIYYLSISLGNLDDEEKKAPKAEKLAGAFGLKFGTMPDPSKVIKLKPNPDGGFIYELKPDAPDKAFQEYTVITTAESTKIHTIRGYSKFSSKAEAVKEMAAVLTALEAKYGPFKKNNPETPLLLTEEGTIAMQVAEQDDKSATLLIMYQSKEWVKIGKKEAEKAGGAQIEGAFGFKFGDVFDPVNALDKISGASGVRYLVKPPNPNPLFSEYYLFITPKTHQISQIWGRGVFPSKDEALKKQVELGTALQGKYGKQNERLSAATETVITQQAELVKTAVVELPSKEGVLLITYDSLKLDKVADRERSEEPAGKVDKSGL